MSTQFFINDPTILLNKDYIFDLWPSSGMCFEAKLNAITRLIILLTILGFILTRSLRILVVGVVTIAIIVILFQTRKQQFLEEEKEEGFQNSGNNNNNTKNNNNNKHPATKTMCNDSSVCGETIVNPETLETFVKSEFQEGNKKNPFSNVLLTEIMDDPLRKSAPPSFNPDIHEDITRTTKKMIQKLNPGIKNTNKQLFSSLTDNFDLDQSMRVFNSNPNTKIPNDQGAFANFLYGDMPSAKGSSPVDNIQREKDNYRYTLY